MKIWSAPRSATSRKRLSGLNATAWACGPDCRARFTLDPFCCTNADASPSFPSAATGSTATLPLA